MTNITNGFQVIFERISKILPPGHDLGQCFALPYYNSFRINMLRTSWQEVLEFLEQKHIIYERLEWYTNAFVVPAKFSRQLLDSKLTLEGKIYAQGLESLLPVLVLAPQAGEHILDLCAAPGSKTTQIAMHMNNLGTLRANEPVKKRFFRLRSVTQLLGSQVRLSMSDGRYLRSHDLFDRILVDAPCSAEGRFIADDPKTYAYWSPRKIREMAHKQKGLLLNAGRLLKEGGVLVYATCTFAPEENEEVVEWFLRKTEGAFKLLAIDLEGVPRYPSRIPECFRVLPGPQWRGFFMAKFTKLFK